jgi:ribosomal protein S18 acetylase RimI-like enzyme
MSLSPSEVQVARADERDQIVQVTRQAGVFNAKEIAAVEELFDDYAAHGQASSYQFLVYRLDGRVAGFACYGPRSLTLGTFDLYWIGTAPGAQRKGVGHALIEATEQAIRSTGGRLLIVETSSRPEYEPARRFYASHGYRREALIKDFYEVGDSLILYSKRLELASSLGVDSSSE